MGNQDPGRNTNPPQASENDLARLLSMDDDMDIEFDESLDQGETTAMSEGYHVDLIDALAAVINTEDRGLLDRLASWPEWSTFRDAVDTRRADVADEGPVAVDDVDQDQQDR